MPEKYDVRVKILSIEGECPREHKAGEEWVVTGKTPEGICLAAFHGLLPHINVLAYGGTFPWAKDDLDSIVEACPDPNNRVLFELRRIKK